MEIVEIGHTQNQHQIPTPKTKIDGGVGEGADVEIVSQC